MKNKFFLFLLFLLPLAVCAQDEASMADFPMDGYVIRVVTNADKTFGFLVLDQRDGKTILQQKSKPYAANQKGFSEKQNAMAAGMWYVRELKNGRRDVKQLTSAKAKEAGITKIDL